MSRWTEQFTNHTFQTSWASLKLAISTAKVDDVTVTTSVKELGRLKKVVAFIDTLIEGLDPELVPLSIWDDFKTQCDNCLAHVVNYASSRNISNIHTANAYADNLLTYVRPYIATRGSAAKSLKDAATSYSEAVDEILERLAAQATHIEDDIKIKQNAISVVLDTVVAKSLEVENAARIIIGDEENEGVSQKINAVYNSAISNNEEINTIHDELIVGDSKNRSTLDLINEAKEDSLAAKNEIVQYRTDVDVTLKDLNKFHENIYGKLNPEGEREGGLLTDFNNRIKNLSDFETTQKDKYIALNEQIETLLPGATSAGLAEAYDTLASSFDNPIKNASTIYYVAVGLMIFGAFFTAIDDVGWFYINFIDVKEWDATIRSIAQKIPFYAPVIWLAYYASKRRSEYQRLQQEYAHKKALASSYHSYKKQLEALDSKDLEMQKAFIEKTIDAIVHNASTTLDGYHGDKMPAHEFLEKLINNDSMWDVIKKKLGLGS